MLKLCFYIFCCECNSIRFMYVCMSGTKNSWLLKDSTECTQVLKGVDNICTIYTWNMHNISTIYAQYMQSICTTYKYMFNSCTTFAYKLTNIFPKIFWINIKGMPKIAQGLQQGIKRQLNSSVSAFHWVLGEGLPLLAVVIADWRTFWYGFVFIVKAFIWSQVISSQYFPGIH